MAITDQIRSDLRADLGDQTAPYAFSNAELDRLYARQGEDYDKTLLLAIKQLLFNSAKFYDYVSGHTRQEQEKIFDHLKALYTMLKAEVDSKQQVQILGLRTTPPYDREKPTDAEREQLDELID